jgi:hypothetical protein
VQNHSTIQRKVRTLFESAVKEGGLDLFKLRFEQSLGIVRDDANHPSLDDNAKAVDHADIPPEVACEALMGPGWRKTFEQHWIAADMARRRFEGVGSAVLPGELSTVSGAFDVFAGLVGARMLARPAAPEFIWDRMCDVRPNMYEGGFDIGTRPSIDVTKKQDGTDLPPGQIGPVVHLVPTRVHRNRPLRQQKFVKINWHTARNDLTGSLYQSVDECADLVLYERERKVADALLGVSAGTGSANTFATTVSSAEAVGTDNLAVPQSQDGLVWFPYQKGTYGANVNAAVPAPQTGVLVANYANANETDGAGLTDYTALVRWLKIAALNKDPWTGRPWPVTMRGATILIAPGSRPQLEFLLQARALWQIANAAGTTTGLSGAGTATVSDYNFIREMGIQIVESQYWMSRLVDVGVAKVSSGGTYSHQSLTAASTDTYNTAGSIYSAFYAGFPKRAMAYDQVMPYESVQLPLTSVEYSEQTISYNMFQEQGFPYWFQPREMWRAWA